MFYDTYGRKVVVKATKKWGCYSANAGISCYVIFREKILEMDM